MPDHASNQTPQALVPRLLAAYPQILVADFRCAVGFYVEKLGFAVVYQYGEPPFYGMIARDGASLNLRHVDEPSRHRAADREAVLAANIPVDEVEALFREFRGRGAVFAQVLKKQPWGTTDFLLRDPDGNLLCFASAADSRSQQLIASSS